MPSAAQSSEAPGSASTVGAGSFVNPVIDAEFPDPFVVGLDGTYYAYATGGGGRLLQVATSIDLVSWTPPAEALNGEPSWMAGSTWAPEVYETAGGYLMYYSGRSATARPNGEGAPCISSALADDPAGPFVDETDGPLVCQPDLGGSIDPTAFTDDDGTRYLLWKNDGNCCAIPTRLWMQELTSDGRALAGNEPIDLGLTGDAPWEDGLIEAPTLFEKDGTHYLFYSANMYETHEYAVGYATSDAVTGPYVDADENPILTYETPATAVGTGHQSIFADDDGDLWMAYHAWDVDAIGYSAGGRRALWIDPLAFAGDKPDVLGPNPEPQPVP